MAPQSRRNFGLLLCLVWGLGAHYLYTDPFASYDGDFLATFRLKALQYVESNLLSLMSNPDLESVQVGILLGSFHLFNGLPNLGFGILGSTIKTAQLLGLHRGFPRASIGPSTSNAYANVWFALEIFEKYAAIAFGRPCGIDDSDCEVPEIQAPEGDPSHLTYHIQKCRLYRIIGVFLGRRKESKRSGPVIDIHEKLRAWFNNVPRELKVDSQATINGVDNLVPMQALALQLAYDNIQIVLHRQAVFGSQLIGASDTHKTASIDQLIESAIRTAKTPSIGAIMPICQSSHAAMHAVICLFTAGVVLSALYLSRVVENRSNELLPGLERIISFFGNFPGQYYHLAPQCLEILQKLHTKCLRSLPNEDTNEEHMSGTIVDELAGSFLSTEDFSSLVDFENTGSTDLLDFASGSSLQGVAQAWLWSDNTLMTFES